MNVREEEDGQMEGERGGSEMSRTMNERLIRLEDG